MEFLGCYRCLQSNGSHGSRVTKMVFFLTLIAGPEKYHLSIKLKYDIFDFL